MEAHLESARISSLNSDHPHRGEADTIKGDIVQMPQSISRNDQPHEITDGTVGDSGNAAVIEFIGALSQLRLAAGMPSLREISKISHETRGSGRYVLSMTTISNVLSGRRKRLPPWPWVASYLDAIKQISAHRDMSDVELEADQKLWQLRWIEAMESSENGR
ncbi:hypothetical protein E1264_33425 [Actinomadura sp. KC216]|uniref:hypothetical protein n=1 Tax=Actinomadura sp. KC216 TaxID=2530370 RepID=UPI001053B4AE|nr:hypothetical protein [Actinomadura sp. KC216]TDB80910.1 hypothetical protein E1264_33425 [Actinomadura sp. KC216]